jgi:hypothetical protein
MAWDVYIYIYHQHYDVSGFAKSWDIDKWKWMLTAKQQVWEVGWMSKNGAPRESIGIAGAYYIRQPHCSKWCCRLAIRPSITPKSPQLSTPGRHLGTRRITSCWRKTPWHTELSRAVGRVMPSRLWLNPLPNVKVWREFGRFTPSRLRLKRSPNVKVWREFGRFTPSRLLPDSDWNIRRMSRSEDCLARSRVRGSG